MCAIRECMNASIISLDFLIVSLIITSLVCPHFWVYNGVSTWAKPSPEEVGSW